MPTEGDDDGLVLDGEHGGSRLLWPGRQVVDGAALPPLGDGLLVDAVAVGQGPQALLTMLDCLTDCRCRRGAAVQNLSYSASFHSREKSAPSNPGIEHLGLPSILVGTGKLHDARSTRDCGYTSMSKFLRYEPRDRYSLESMSTPGCVRKSSALADDPFDRFATLLKTVP